jgi:hypothetical protein
MTDEEYAIAILGAFEKLVFTAERIASALEGMPNKRELITSMVKAASWNNTGPATNDGCRHTADAILDACKEPKP